MKVEIYSKPQCPYCDMAKNLAEQKGYDLTYKMLDQDKLEIHITDKIT